MADFTFGQLPQQTAENFMVGVENLGSHQEYITISSYINITPASDVQSGVAVPDDANSVAVSQGALNKLIQIVSERGQPIISGSVVASGSGPITYTIYMVNEHYNAWGAVQGVTGAQLVDRLAADGINYGFGGSSFVGSVSGTTLTVTAVNTGSIGLGSLVTGAGITGTGATCYVSAFLTGTGGVGTYTLSTTTTSVTSEAITTSAGNAVSFASVIS